MKLTEWSRRGLEPAIGMVEQWISDQLGLLGAEEDACLVLPLRTGAGARILVATDVGLYDATWERLDAVELRQLTATWHMWHDVRGVRIAARTALDERLMRRDPIWSLTIAEPQVAATEDVDDAAIIAFYQACRSNIREAGG